MAAYAGSHTASVLYGDGAVLHFGRQRIRSGTQTITRVVDKPAVFVGVDPYNKRIDRNSDDNLARIESP